MYGKLFNQKQGIKDLRKQSKAANSKMDIDKFELKNFQLANAFDKIAKLPMMGAKKTSKIVVQLLKQNEIQEPIGQIEGSSIFEYENGLNKVHQCKKQMANEYANKKVENRSRIDGLVTSVAWNKRSAIYSLRDKPTTKQSQTDDRAIKNMLLKQSGVSRSAFDTENSNDKIRRTSANLVDNTRDRHDYWIKKFMRYESDTNQGVGFLDQNSEVQLNELRKANGFNFGPIDFTQEELDERSYIQNRQEEMRIPKSSAKSTTTNTYRLRYKKVQNGSKLRNVNHISRVSQDNSIDVSYIENTKRTDLNQIDKTYSADNENYELGGKDNPNFNFNQSIDFDKQNLNLINIENSIDFTNQQQNKDIEFDSILKSDDQQIMITNDNIVTEGSRKNASVPKIHIESYDTDNQSKDNALMNIKGEMLASQNTKKESLVTLNDKRESLITMNGRKETLTSMNDRKETLITMNGKKETLTSMNDKRETLNSLNGKKETSVTLNGQKEIFNTQIEQKELLTAHNAENEILVSHDEQECNIKMNTNETEGNENLETPHLQTTEFLPSREETATTNDILKSFIIKNERPYLYAKPNRHRYCADRKYAENLPCKNQNKSVSPSTKPYFESLCKASNDYSKLMSKNRGMSNITYRKHKKRDLVNYDQKYTKFYDGIQANKEIVNSILKDREDGKYKEIIELVNNDSKDEIQFAKLKKIQGFYLNYDQGYKSDNTWYGLYEKFQGIMKQTDTTQDYIKAMRHTKKKFERHEHIAKHKRKLYGNNIAKLNMSNDAGSGEENEDEKDKSKATSRPRTTNRFTNR